MKRNTFGHLAIAAALASLAGAASSAEYPLLYSEANDCAGLFSNPNGFASCRIPAGIDPMQSPIIIKFGYDKDTGLFTPTINTALFPSIDGTEFTLTPTGNDYTTGIWTYHPGSNDPEIHWFVAKAGNDFKLYNNPGDPDSDSWETPVGQRGQPLGLSHLSFYGSGGLLSASVVPEPNSSGLALLALGLVGASLAVRRRSDGAD